MPNFKIKRESDGRTFEFEAFSQARGEWGIRLVTVDGEIVDGFQTDSDDFGSEKKAKLWAKDKIEWLDWLDGYGWCVSDTRVSTHRRNGKWAKTTQYEDGRMIIALGWSGELKAIRIHKINDPILSRIISDNWLDD